ncbi:MAG TPA: hypothetical protein VGN57_03500 [Pirellulaceae bacterium]|jgi:hypothetical protein|nr:hypothetical protein [Pirellulaceae bacterium]
MLASRSDCQAASLRSAASVRKGAAAASFALALAFAAPVVAIDFRVQTKVFVQNEDKPVSETTTVFKLGLVYDFPAGPEAAWTIMDPFQKRFVLMRADKKQRANVSFDELIDLVGKYQKMGVEAGKTAVFDPKLAESLEEETNRLVLQNEAMKYRVKALQPTDPAVPDLYRSFGDWFSRLNVRYAGAYPPFGRLNLNEAMQKRGLIPSEIEWTVLPQGRMLETRTLRSTHEYQWTLSTNDEKKVELAQKQLVEFREVTFLELMGEADVAASKSDAKR